MATHEANWTVDFELGEDAPQNASARAQQEDQWRTSHIDARHHFSVREALQVQKPAILNAIGDYERTRVLAKCVDQGGSVSETLSKLTADVMAMIVEHAMPGQGQLLYPIMCEERRRLAVLTLGDRARGSAFRVFVRVRPLHIHECDHGEYVSLDDRTGEGLVCHDARLARSGRRLSMLHRWYSCDALFNRDASDAVVCASVLLPLLERVTQGKCDATALLYGQTGAGKTHNLRCFIECVQGVVEKANSELEVLFFEVATDGCHDLLNERAKVALRCDAEHNVHVCGARRAVVRSGEDLTATLAAGLAQRSTVATEANPISSRSHAILEIRFSSSLKMLRIVDLAGSERNYETHRMSSRQFQRESAAINKSLMALKTCLREAARRREALAAADKENIRMQARVRVPYRDSSLTRVLRQCFEDDDHDTAILAAVSPAASSVIHTLNTMDHVTLMAPHLVNKECEVNVPRVGCSGGSSFESVPVRLWTPTQVIEWVSNANGGRFSQVVLPPGIDGKGLLGLNARRLSELVESGHELGRAEGEGWYVSAQARVGRALFNALRDAQMQSPIMRG